MSNMKRYARAVKRRYKAFVRQQKLHHALKTSRNVIYVFGAPFHSNLGDQAQTYCTEKWAVENYPDCVVRIYDTKALTANGYEILRVIQRVIKPTDHVFLHSGYHSTDLYMLEENMQREVVKRFPNHQIVILPQTINYTKREEEETSVQIYNSHRNLLFMCRDEVSYEKAKALFPSVPKLLFPDIVTTMIGRRHYDHDRHGVLLCLRNDQEAYYSEEKIAGLVAALSGQTNVTRTDTTITMDADLIAENREQVLHDTWESYSHYEAVITDRYHGTIFSLIAGTPVIVLSSTDHKLQSGVKWFPQEFSDYVFYAEDLDKALQIWERIHSTAHDHRLPMYFQENYYDKLKQLIEDINCENM